MKSSSLYNNNDKSLDKIEKNPSVLELSSDLNRLLQGCKDLENLKDLIVKHCGKDLDVEWDTTKPSGDAKRLFDMSRANSYGFYPAMEIEDGIIDTINWFKNNQKIVDKRHNAFK